jgi:hypothetical protein
MIDEDTPCPLPLQMKIIGLLQTCAHAQQCERKLLEKPWLKLPGIAPFVLSEDIEPINRFNADRLRIASRCGLAGMAGFST